ncbi:MAG: 2-amino-4-hydroxy-6-hydroxymethyldihydropteridine diphosphokinase [Lachnospiraceae bacterium]|nr:2-amino-4-hydroxy-6-hydroxymethyldihydropteridine diphosphokinase [Lachnospiraceae bacterium]
MDKIIIRNLEVFANHGVFPEENKLGQKFLVSAELLCDTEKAGRTDELAYSIHYGLVAEEITSYMKAHTKKLIEAAAEEVAEHLLLMFPLMRGIILEVQKPWAPVGLPLETVSVKIERGWHKAYVAFGSNMGDKKGHIEAGIQALREDRRIRMGKISDMIVTKPYGGVEQDDFLNGCLELDTLLSPYELLEVLHRVEQQEKRERLVHWGPRTLDLDLLFYENEILESKELAVPHPELEKRLFVLEPLSQIAPYKVHPVVGKRVKTLLEELLEKTTED